MSIDSSYLQTSLSLDIFSLLLTVITISSISGGISLQCRQSTPQLTQLIIKTGDTEQCIGLTVRVPLEIQIQCRFI